MKNWKMFGILAGIAILALAQIQTALADENSWSTGGPYDASPYSIAIHPFDSQRIYIGTTENFIFETTDGGTEWSSLLNGGSPDPDGRIEAKTVRVLKIHPFGPDTMFAATTRGFYKSIDAGQSWSRISLLWPAGFDALEINRENPPVVFLGTWGSAWRSTDGGQNWMQMAPNHQLTGSVRPIVADPVRHNIIYAGNNTTVRDASIWKSTDSGVTWSNIHNNLQYGAPDFVAARGIAVDPVDPKIVYFARICSGELGEALVKSTNGGESWTDITPPGLAENWLYSVEVSPLDHNTVFVCSGMNGILRSMDGGENWEEINEGVTGMNRLALSVVFDSATGILYHGRNSGGIYRSFNNGDIWEKISYNITGIQVFDIAANFRNPDTLYTATHNGLYMSTDRAASWEYIELNFPDPMPRSDNVEVDPYDPSYVYVSYYGHNTINYNGALYRSTDGGATWESFTQGLLSGRCYTEIKVADYGGGVRRLFMASTRGLFRSDDLGESWSLCMGGLPSNSRMGDIEVSPADPDLVFVNDGPFITPVYKSTDGGESWVLLTNSLNSIKEIACDPVNPDIVYLIKSRDSHNPSDGPGIYKSTDGGQSWENITNDLPHPDEYYSFSGLVINPLNPDNVFVWSYNRGVFQSHDGGESWEDFNDNLQTSYTKARTLIDPIDTSRVFVGIWGNSVWEITRVDTTVGVYDNGGNVPLAFLSSSYPNPFNPSTVIEYSLPEESFVTVDIYDMLGRKVKTIVSGKQEAGQHQVIWDAENQASSVYFYKINTERYSNTGMMTLLK